MFQSILVFENVDILLCLLVLKDVLNELFVLLLLFLLLLLLGFFLHSSFGLVDHHTFIFKIFQFDKFGELFVLNSTDQNNLLESFEIFKLLSMRKESQVKALDNGTTL